MVSRVYGSAVRLPRSLPGITPLLLAAALCLGGLCADARAQSFSIQNVANDGTYVASSHYGTWKAARGVYGEAALISTGPGTVKPSWATTQHIQFDVTGHNYFSAPGHGGHLGVFVRGDIYTPNSWNPNYPYRGHGVVLGNLSYYPSFYNPSVGNQWMCSPAPSPSTITVEVAGAVSYSHDNCVFGNAVSAPLTLVDGITYRVYLRSSWSWVSWRNTTSYSIYRNDAGSLTYLFSAQISYAYDDQTLLQNGVAQPLGGWFVGEVGRGINSSWSFQIDNVSSTWE